MKAYAECQRDMEGRLGTVQAQNKEVVTPRDLALAEVEIHCTLWLIITQFLKSVMNCGQPCQNALLHEMDPCRHVYPTPA